MNLTKGERYLVTTEDWFVAPDGNNYNAVFGTACSTPHAGTQIIGNMHLPKEKVMYAVKCDSVCMLAPVVDVKYRGDICKSKSSLPHIYLADTDD